MATSKNWASIRVKAEYDRSSVSGNPRDAVRAIVRGWPKRVTDKYRDEFGDIANDAADIIRDVIYTSTTPTGEKRQESGGEPGRIETGMMLESVKAKKMRDTKDGGVGYAIGWTDGKPGYAIFQEQGTKYVKAMDSLRLATEWMKYQINNLRKAGPKKRSASTNTGFGAR